jgi:hypothetical protein
MRTISSSPRQLSVCTSISSRSILFIEAVATGILLESNARSSIGMVLTRLFGVEPPRPRIEAIRIVDMSASNAWAEFAAVFARTRSAHLEHEQAKSELKSLMPEDAKESIGHGVRAKRSKSGAVSFDLLRMEGGDAAV